METKRSDSLKHKPRGIIKWAPFNSLPEFTMQLKEVKKQSKIENEVKGDYE
ncbi:hypothetical protein RZE82_00960 [Mollicutes bacterium LVI A0039]|nr:hypothetical protein RZE82_00960 [Mollicutes bacterium LVI A0039]